MNKDFGIENKSILVIGKRHSGKSFLIKHLLAYYSPRFHKVFACSGTERVNKFYEKSGLIPKESIYEDYTEEFGNRLIKSLETENAGLEPEDQKRVLLILDDLVSTNNLHDSKTVEYFFTCARHINLSVILLSQHIHKISPTVRDNADVVFVGQQNAESVKTLSSKFRVGKISTDDYIKMYDKSTEDYKFLVINCNSVKNRDNINESYGCIKAPKEEYKIVNEIIENKRVIMKKNDSWDALFSDKKKKQTIIEKITIQKKVLVPVKPYIQNVA